MNKQKVDQINGQIADFNQAIQREREKQAAQEKQIQSLGQDGRERLAEEKTSMEAKLESGLGSFSLYDDLLTRIAQQEANAKLRAIAYAAWKSCAATIKDLEARRELLRPKLQEAIRQP